MVELVNNDHSPLAPPVMQQIRFRSAMMMPETGVQRAGQAIAPAPLWLLIALSLLSMGWLVRYRYRHMLIKPLTYRRDK